MKLKVNKNCLWAETFVNSLASLGLRYACVSPGSRNTPLNFAFAKNKKIKTFVHIDERSSGFFALGVARALNQPVALVCTSGTATAEFYPAIIEAYKQRTPLIVCTADRPPELLNLGANQTIYQENIYKNHIRYFADAGLPVLKKENIKALSELAFNAFRKSSFEDAGPVHVNFPFNKPLEPKAFTDEIDESVAELASPNLGYKLCSIFNKEPEKELWFKEILVGLEAVEKGIIVVGPGSFTPDFYKNCAQLSELLGYPILADAVSGFRFGSHSKKNVITNFDAMLRSNVFTASHLPRFIIHFGRTVTSKYLEEFLAKCTAPRYMVNEYGDWFDPSDVSLGSYECLPEVFCGKMFDQLKSIGLEKRKNNWLGEFISPEKTAFSIKQKTLNTSGFPSEGRLINELLNIIPSGSNIMISNSMPIRDFDNFASISGKKLNLFHNRGASGIDGIISTALGIAASTKKTTFLLTGDLAFYYDLTSLATAVKYKIPLVIILVNNNGGGIFEILPVSQYGSVFREYFLASHNLSFCPLVKAFGGNYYKIGSWNGFKSGVNKALEQKNFSVLEIKTEAKSSLEKRKAYWKGVSEALENNDLR